MSRRSDIGQRPPAAHFGTRPSPRRDDGLLDEIGVTYVSPMPEDPEIRRKVVEWLARLLAKPAER